MKTQCPGCKAKFNVSEQNTGKKAKCPKCTQPFIIEPFRETPVQVTEKPAEPTKTEQKPVKEKPKSKKLSKALYVYAWAVTRIIAGGLAALGLVMALNKATNPTLIAAFVVADIFLLGNIAIELLLFYKMWGAIGDSEASVSPPKAVGFLFIPVFNIYWAISMITGFAEDYNSFIRRCSMTAEKLPFVLYFIYAIAFVLSGTVVTIPMVCMPAFTGLINKAFMGYRSVTWFLVIFAATAGTAHFISYILFAKKTCTAVNALPEKSA